jgi:hypothetical protein
MTLMEAITVYLTLFRKPNRTQQENAAFAAAWLVLSQEGDRIVRRDYPGK